MQARGKTDRSANDQECGPIFPADSQNEQRATYAAAAAGDLGRHRQKDGRCPHEHGAAPGGKACEGSARRSVKNRDASKAKTEKALQVVAPFVRALFWNCAPRVALSCMSDPSEFCADVEESDKRRLQETLHDMSIAELFELLIDVEAVINEASNSPDLKQGPVLAPDRAS